MGFRCSRCDSPWKGIEALADLIDPDIIPDNRDRTERSLSETTEGPTSCDKAQTCDRDALLALADELEKWSLMCDHCDRQVSPLDVTKYARRIREAVGA